MAASSLGQRPRVISKQVGGSPVTSQRSRRGKQIDPSGVDFSGCEADPDTGLCCVEKVEQVTTLQKDPILECTHKNVEQCHYTYVTQFTPSQEEVSQPLSIVHSI